MIYRQKLDTFIERVRSGKVCLGAHSNLNSPQVIEMYGLSGLDFVIIGAEVDSLDYGPMENLMRAAAISGITPIVKIRRPDPHIVTDIMNFGGALVMTPDVTSAPQLEALVAATRFRPVGTRGECPSARYTSWGLMPLDESSEVANTTNCIVPIIESVEALENIEAILSVDGVDIIMIGPIDFSRSLKLPVGFKSPKIFDVIEQIAEVARRHNKAVMTPLIITPATSDSTEKIIAWNIEELVRRGVTLFYQVDMHVLADHYRNLLPIRGVRIREEEVDEEVGGTEETVEATSGST